MRRVAGAGLVLASALFLAVATPARANEPMAGDGQPAKALAIQALAILEQGLSQTEAMEKVDLALEAKHQEGVKADVLERAKSALEAGDPGQARQLLQTAFTGTNIHVVGLTVRPGIESVRVAAGIAGGAVLALAALGLLRRQRVDRRVPTA